MYVVTALGLLVFSKYINWGLNLAGQPALWPQWATPAAISFITFQGIWAITQSYQGLAEENAFVIKRIAHICFFPSLSSGPIVSLLQWQKMECPPQLEVGFLRLSLGLFQKLVLASVANILVTQTYADPSLVTTQAVWQSIFAYSFELYFDFAGYSNMALGLALIMGFKLPENFNHPYLSENIQIFWRKWHMSLSTFFRDNVYIGLLGGNKYGVLRKGFNAAIVMLLCGLWHGANMTYVVWGALHGVALLFLTLSPKFKIPKPMSMLITFLFVTYAWVWFRAENIEQALAIQRGLFYNAGLTDGASWGWLFLALCSIWTICEAHIQTGLLTIARQFKGTMVTGLAFGFITVTTLACSPSGLPNFIYYQF